MQIDWTSFALGAVAGLVLAFLFKLRDLKRLDLMLKRIGIELGVEGFEDKRTPSGSGVSLGDISGTAGDIAGRDIDKSIGKRVDQKIDRMISRNSSIYQAVQKAASDATKQALLGLDAGEVNGGEGGTLFQQTFKFEFRTEDSGLLSTLQRIQGSNNRWFERYTDACSSSPEFRQQIQDFCYDLMRRGWQASLIRPVDNIQNGLLVEIVAYKSMVLR
ncbi:MAG: hypothetical protein HC936_18160 [Leptolyngbyaceae cyanobacterium SU_3_3]|nr:hypothetical protein [Leptolyngbyaceae cyanobacterium SU_3_3]